MPINYPKFDQKINDQIQNAKMQGAKSRIATVVQYDRITNNMTVIMESHYSDTLGNIVDKIPCPITYGVQSVAPEPGDRCVIGFRDDNERHPYVISFINDYQNGRLTNMSIANSGIPRFLI